MENQENEYLHRRIIVYKINFGSQGSEILTFENIMLKLKSKD